MFENQHVPQLAAMSVPQLLAGMFGGSPCQKGPGDLHLSTLLSTVPAGRPTFCSTSSHARGAWPPPRTRRALRVTVPSFLECPKAMESLGSCRLDAKTHEYVDS